MRQITRAAADAFINGRNFGSGNTTVGLDADGTVRMFLHGNLIAEQGLTHLRMTYLRMTLAGWNTPTTRERLNGLLEVMGFDGRFFQRDFAPYFVRHLRDGSVVGQIESYEWIIIE